MRTSIVALVVLAACNQQAAGGPGRRVAGKPVETRPPNAKFQRPAFAGQTRAPYKTANVRFEVRTIVKGLDHPWALAFLPDGEMLVTEKPGRMRIVRRDGTLSKPVAGVPAVDARNQGGLLDVALEPAFEDSGRIYWSFAERRGEGNGTSVARGRLVRDTTPPHLEDVEVIWRQQPSLDSTKHFGSRLVFAPDGALFVTTGERFIPEGRKQAQRLDSELGKVMRIPADGSSAEVFSYGHRNIQAAALHPETGALWIVEHGAKGGDEINIVQKGKNYGWPVITYGIDYSGEKIGEGITVKLGMEQPIYYWDPVIAPSGMAFYTESAFPAWRGSLFVGGLASKHIARLTLDGNRVVGEERLLANRARFRDVRVGPDGLIYALTDEDNGELLVLAPAEARPDVIGAGDGPRTAPARPRR